MISSYTCDKINIIRYTYDEWNNSTRSVAGSGIKARIEDFNRLVKNAQGKEVVGKSVIFLDSTEDINYNDRIQLRERNGMAVENADKEYDIINLGKVHSYTNETWEIII